MSSKLRICRYFCNAAALGDFFAAALFVTALFATVFLGVLLDFVGVVPASFNALPDFFGAAPADDFLAGFFF
ncbi:MAG TPA: hypothetical protein VN516_09600, partial [Candidatus Baltobacteraceae bacterium]|nr:hypothetical protein [Candidatus Baltobacteraceae bacterium]